ncbi:hypothetical protein F0562_021105 [Nyssa sinensis]|uniref:ATP-grasp fold succinyl-CoA synthetase-type domain-containing protein n=1 Tax=Nyssa sinensis TaxID=561372 RepID=A0A5J5BMI5_9ASTE|nr:hypothetical protein F0562_021105 [Nyssa sinensis]
MKRRTRIKSPFPKGPLFFSGQLDCGRRIRRLVRVLLNKVVHRSLSIAGKLQQQQLRRLNIHEYQLVVKSQILAGGRGLGTFKSVHKGGVHIVNADQVEEIAGKMVGQILVTKQTRPQGKVVSKVYLCKKLSLSMRCTLLLLLTVQLLVLL